ncbi:MAG TPA: histidinol-phosphate transaminase, partial [Blattabacteriaceae bacterium]
EVYHRYPNPFQVELKKEISFIKNICDKKIFIGNGSDEIIDLIIRIFCSPGLDKIIICTPSYGMYEVNAKINDIEILKIPLKKEYKLDVNSILSSIPNSRKLIFLCSPNNPTGNDFLSKDMERILKIFTGIVVIDEAYIDFSNKESFINLLDRYSKLMVMQTLSKAWGLAGIRIGIAFSGENMISLMNRVKPAYNISKSSQEIAIKTLKQKTFFEKRLKTIIKERERISKELICLVDKVFPSSANFLLTQVSGVQKIFQCFFEKNLIVRDRSKIKLCKNCLRITVGTYEENNFLLKTLKNINIDE